MTGFLEHLTGKERAEECACGHMRVWHNEDGTVCQFHSGNPERCACPTFRPRAGMNDADPGE